MRHLLAHYTVVQMEILVRLESLSFQMDARKRREMKTRSKNHAANLKFGDVPAFEELGRLALAAPLNDSTVLRGSEIVANYGMHMACNKLT